MRSLNGSPPQYTGKLENLAGCAVKKAAKFGCNAAIRMRPGKGWRSATKTQSAPGLPSLVRCKDGREDDPNSGAVKPLDAHSDPEVYLFSGGLKVGPSRGGRSAAHSAGSRSKPAVARTSHRIRCNNVFPFRCAQRPGGGPGLSDAAAKLRSGGATGAKRQGVPPHHPPEGNNRPVSLQ